jgi:hypothetical protein
LRIAADQPDALPALHLLAGARHRDLQELEPAGGNARAERRDPVRIARAGAQDDLAGAIAQLRQQLPFDHGLDLVRVEHGKRDRIAPPGHLGDGSGSLTAECRQPRSPGCIDVEAGHGQTCPEQPKRQRLAHQPDADKSHRH